MLVPSARGAAPGRAKRPHQPTPAGAYLAKFVVGPALYRDDSTHTLSPAPDLRPVFPLPVYLTAGVVPGMPDPDPTVAADPTRPLVFYALGSDVGDTLRLRLRSGAIELDW